LRVRAVVSSFLFVEAALLLYAVAVRFPALFAAGVAVVGAALTSCAFGLRAKHDAKIRVRINTVITGEPALWLIEWKRRGLVTSNSDAVIQAFRALHEKITELDLKMVQLRNYRRIEEE